MPGCGNSDSDKEWLVAVDRGLLFVISSSGIGEGEPDLGEKLMGSFLAMLVQAERLPKKMIFMNSGVFLTTEGSPHLATLNRFVEAGTTIASCGTCLDYYGRREKLMIGTAGDMKDTVQALLEFPKVRTI